MVLLWSADFATAPDWRNPNSSFESWAYRNGFDQRLEFLARERLLEKRRLAGTQEWVYRLTAQGRTVALGGRDPEAAWQRPWDGKWRLLLFDLPQHERQLRIPLWRWLRANVFGNLQDSVWITPDPDQAQLKGWRAKHPDVESIVAFEGRPAGGATDAEVVTGAWDFAAINARYVRYQNHLEKVPDQTTETEAKPEALLEWIREERALWALAVQSDPLLPEPLLPAGYEGRKAWKHRQAIARKIAPRLRHPKAS